MNGGEGCGDMQKMREQGEGGAWGVWFRGFFSLLLISNSHLNSSP